MTENVTPSNSTPRAGDCLVVELRRLGVRYLSLGSPPEDESPLAPEVLVFGLATSGEARLRAALVPLFLWRPDYAQAAQIAAQQLTGRARVTLVCNYSAAVVLQDKYAARLTALGREDMRLPDIFASELGLTPDDDQDARLAAVAACNASSTGDDLNWQGGYEHAAKTFLRFAKPMPAWSC